MDITGGKPQPLGSTYDGRGTNFCVFSSVAHRIEVCFFDDARREERVTLPGRTGPFWHGYIDSIHPGQRYGFRVHGPWDPGRGHLCSPETLLLDPHARAFDGDVQWDDSLFPCNPQNLIASSNPKDTARFVPKSIVVDPAFDWDDDRSPGTRLEDTVIYEIHVKGFTVLNPRIPPELRGTYAGLAHPASIEHLTTLGVTAVELLPVQQFIHRRRLIERGLRNYWGYDPVGYFAPHNEYASDKRRGRVVREFKEMVRALHSAGLEVFLDVVFNHTGEGGVEGPVLSFKGFDNKEYYRLSTDNALRYLDLTGTQNTLNTESSHVRQMIIDSLVYWVTEMHVDGFRFDLAPVLARENGNVVEKSPFFDTLRRHPILSGVKLIAEPWDLGENGYQLGRFPEGWSEWNDKYRDEVRGFWNGRPASGESFARRLAGSPDVFATANRTPQASVNFVTCHDGYTLHDLVSYETKHNEANCEANRDGHNDNRSWHCGADGPTDNAGINTLRDRQKRNLLATLFLSCGVPMLLGGDEIGRTQGGNNNAYCQDNETSWLDWNHADRELADFVASMIHLRRKHPVFRRTGWPIPSDDGASQPRAVRWYDVTGREIPLNSGAEPLPAPLQLFLSAVSGEAAGAEDRSTDLADVLVMFNPTDRDVTFHIPEPPDGRSWIEVVDTALAVQWNEEAAPRPENKASLTAHSLAVLVRRV